MKKVAVIFPGQGSQTVGMLSDIANHYSEVEAVYAEASKVLGFDLWQLVKSGPAQTLDKTVHTQPALLAASYAIWKIIQKKSNQSFKPVMLAGHSLGEYTALVCAGALSFEEAIRLVAVRGELMQAAVPEGVGALAAMVGLTDEAVSDLCEEVRQDTETLTPANFNCPGQVVIAGHMAAVERALSVAKEKGARLAKLLPVSVPSHCHLMKPAAIQFAKKLSAVSIHVPRFHVLNNVDVTVYQEGDDIRDGLVRQLYSPVRWSEIMQAMVSAGVEEVIECGPGKVLTGLNKRMLPESVELKSTADLASLTLLIEGVNYVANH